MSVRYKDYYQVLGVERTATVDEIRKAYRRLAREWHPDHNKSDDAAKRFQEINEAHQVLSDAEKRAQYDRLGRHYQHGQDFRPPPGFERFTGGFGGNPFGSTGGGGGDARFSDFFSMLFGADGPFAGGHPGGRTGWRGDTLEAEITLTLEQALAGGKHEFRFQTMVSQPGGAVSEEPRRIELSIPSGVREGTKIRLAGQGGPGRGGAENGDLLLVVRFAEHPRFTAEGHDLRAELPVHAVDAALGGAVEFVTLDSRTAQVKIAAGTQSGTVLRLRGQGLPTGRADGPGRGDLLLRVRIDVPAALSDDERAAWERLRELRHVAGGDASGENDA